MASIVNTRSNEDHFGGLLLFLEHNPDQNLSLANLSFYTPYMDVLADHGFKRIRTAFENRGWTAKVLRANGGFRDGLTHDYTVAQSVIKFSGAGQEDLQGVVAVQKGPGDRGTLTNWSSTLMHTGTAIDKKAAIYLTDDNNAGRTAIDVASQHFSIYKIQHHGAYEDSMLRNTKLEVHPGVVHSETLIYQLMAYEASGERLFFASAVTDNILRAMIAELDFVLRDRRIDSIALYPALSDRQNELLAATSNVPGDKLHLDSVQTPLPNALISMSSIFLAFLKR